MREPDRVAKHLQIGEPWAGLTVFDVVRRAFPQIAPRDVVRMVRSGKIQRNRGLCSAHARLSPGDLLTVPVARPVRKETSRVLRVNEVAETSAGPLPVVREDEELLVVSKPSGCASHPALKHSGDTLIERVHAYLGIERESAFRPGLANRLDLETSGIVLVAKTRAAQRRLGRHFQRGLVRKHYLALVGGWLAEEEGEIRVPLLRHPDSRERCRFPPGHPRLRGILQEAVTRFRTVERLAQPLRATFLSVEILTGRTHQIRRHLSRAGHPLAGDGRYGDPGLNADVAHIGGLRRLFLHAHRVLVDHPRSGELLDLSAPLPADLVSCLRSLGASGAPPGARP